ncbi:MAG TPA: hypothetical protein VEL73_01425, partial [Mycobacteriales bacterium]|nr:hypothetical protein [Mycobacteriales bacterium]
SSLGLTNAAGTGLGTLSSLGLTDATDAGLAAVAGIAEGLLTDLGLWIDDLVDLLPPPAAAPGATPPVAGPGSGGPGGGTASGMGSGAGVGPGAGSGSGTGGPAAFAPPAEQAPSLFPPAQAGTGRTGGSLPFTGIDLWLLLLVGVLTLVTGSALLAAAGRRLATG